MFRFYGWFLNSAVLPDTALRVFLLFRYRVETNAHLQDKKIIEFSRRHLCFSTGLSYNSVQTGLKELHRMGLIQLDPLGKGSKHTARLTEPTEYNWNVIKSKMALNTPDISDKK